MKLELLSYEVVYVPPTLLQRVRNNNNRTRTEQMRAKSKWFDRRTSHDVQSQQYLYVPTTFYGRGRPCDGINFDDDVRALIEMNKSEDLRDAS